MSTALMLNTTPLEQEHIRLGAKMVAFGGWHMPIQYSQGILAEYEANRRAVTILDCSHMGEFLVEGDARQSGLDHIVTQTITDMPIKTCRYGAMLNDNGGIIDDLIVYRKAQDQWMIVVNASNIEKNAEHFKRSLTPQSHFEDVSMKTGKLDLQGPRSRDVLRPLVGGIETLAYYSFDQFRLLDVDVLISRTGYTGELGYEIYCPWEKTSFLWNQFLKIDKVTPCGLGVRDVLRTEMCYSLYGHELDEAVTPLEAGISFFVDFKKDFIGKDALSRQKTSGAQKKIAYFISDSRRSPRAGHQLWDAEGLSVGTVTSGTFSPGLQRGIGIGFVDALAAKEGRLFFGDAKVREPASFTKRPFYKQGSLKD